MALQAGADRPQENPAGPIKVFILAGQSNMEGHGVVSMDGENTAHGHHWFGNAESNSLIGDALGQGMRSLLEK